MRKAYGKRVGTGCRRALSLLLLLVALPVAAQAAIVLGSQVELPWMARVVDPGTVSIAVLADGSFAVAGATVDTEEGAPDHLIVALVVIGKRLGVQVWPTAYRICLQSCQDEDRLHLHM